MKKFCVPEYYMHLGEIIMSGDAKLKELTKAFKEIGYEISNYRSCCFSTDIEFGVKNLNPESSGNDIHEILFTFRTYSEDPANYYIIFLTKSYPKKHHVHCYGYMLRMRETTFEVALKCVVAELHKIIKKETVEYRSVIAPGIFLKDIKLQS